MSYSSEVLADSPLAYYRLGDAPTVATASTSYVTEQPSGAIDGNAATYWTTNGVSTGWLRVQLSSAYVATEYSIRRRDDIANRNPKDWTWEGSNDGSSWTTLDTQTGITWGTAGETKSFSFTNTTAYTYYRLNVTANNGNTYLSVAELGITGLNLATPVMADSSGNGRDGLYSGTPPAGTSLLAGDSDPSIDLNGTNQRGLVTYDAAWMPQAQFTVEAIIKPDTVAAGSACIVARYVPGVSWLLRREGNKVAGYVYNGAYQAAIGATAMSAGVTYHVAMTYDNATLRVYLDAVEDATKVATGISASTVPLAIGSSSSTTEWFDGKIDEVAFYGTALSPTRLAAHVAAATSTPTDATVTATTATATAAGVVPVVSASHEVVAPVASATAAGVVPTVSADATVVAPTAAATADALAPVVTVPGNQTILAPAAAASATGVVPSLLWDATVSAAVASATADALVPVVSADVVVSAPAATATADGLPPTTSTFSADATVDAPAATATATALAPVWTQVLSTTTDTANAQGGISLEGSGTATVTRPVAAPPATLVLATRVDKAAAYPTPTMVNGRPT